MLPALKITNVSHSFGQRKVLHEVDLTVQRGQYWSLLGLNGGAWV